MDDLRDRLSQLDRLPSEARWDTIQGRAPRSDVEVDLAGVPDRVRRIVAAVVALAVFAGAAGLAWIAIRSEPDVQIPIIQTPTPVHTSIRTFDTGLRFLEGVSVGEGAVWVTGEDLSAQHGELLRLNPTSGDIEARISMPVPGWEFGGAGLTTGLGSVWIAAGSRSDDGGGTWLYRVDPEANRVVDELDLGIGNAADVWVDPSGIWVLTSTDAVLRLIHLDPQTHEVVGTEEIQSDWSQTVAAAGGQIWVLGSTEGDAPPETLFQIDPATDRIIGRSQPAEGGAFFLVASADRLWYLSDGLRALDGATGQQIAGPIDLPEGGCCELTPDGSGGVWLLSAGKDMKPGLWHADQAGVVDMHTDEDLGPEAFGLSSAWDPSTNSIWITHHEQTVSRVEVAPTG